jgi:hypothetical protein
MRCFSSSRVDNIVFLKNDTLGLSLAFRDLHHNWLTYTRRLLRASLAAGSNLPTRRLMAAGRLS